MPVCIILLLLVLGVLAAVLFYRRYRRNRPYEFEPMSMGGMDNEEDL